MIWKLWAERCVSALLATMIVADGILILRARAVVAEMNELLDSGLFRSTSERTISPPRGFSAARERLPSFSSTPRVWAVRYAAKSCGFCAKDTEWIRLARELELGGHPIVVLLPNAQEEIPKPDLVPASANQVAFVPMEWMRRLRVTMTPTVLLFNSEGELIWHRQGVLRSTDVASALEVITNQRSRKEE